MKILQYLTMFCFLSIQAQTLSLDETYRMAKENYPLIKRNDLIEKSKQFNLGNAAKGWFPQINILAQATYQNAVTELPIKIPNLSVDPVSKDQYKIMADIQQTVYEGGMIESQKKLINASAQLEKQKTEIELDQLKERINQLYFGILQTDEQIKTLALSISDLENTRKKLEAQLKNGVVFRSNLDAVKAQKISLDQKIIELQAVKKSFLAMLSVFINQKLDEGSVLLKPEEILISEQNNRAELRLFELQKQVFDAQKSIIKSKNLPKLGIFIQGGYGKPGFNMLKNEFDFFYIGGIRLNIPITGFYTMKYDLENLETQKKEVEIQKDNFLFNHNFKTIQQNNELQKFKELIDKDQEIISLRTSIKKAAAAQLDNGVITINDYLREVNAEENAKIQKIQHEIQYLLTQYNLKAQLNN